MDTLSSDPQAVHHRRAFLLACFTIAYNLVEGLISVGFGIQDETLALFGFGVDSFVEVISGAGIWHMIRRMKSDPAACPDCFEQTALRVTGIAFYLLAGGLCISAAITLWTGHVPENTLWGVIIALVSIVIMYALIREKKRVGQAMHSEAILADAACTRTCMQLSIVLLISSAAYELTGAGWADAVGALIIAWLSVREGKEAIEKARSVSHACFCKND